MDKVGSKELIGLGLQAHNLAFSSADLRKEVFADVFHSVSHS